ncbi:MAG: hypothetical protein EOP47_14410 [Sphingobacteriaceae bacterium]|nr:MAG: hypothetical protein EOP47_14410 [Sphingobacteriaceae bacterium]
MKNFSINNPGRQFRLLFINLICLLALTSCGESAKQKADKLFNEGTTRSADAAEAAGKGYVYRGIQLNDEAIQLFRQTLQADSTHSKAKSALGHSFYVAKNYTDALTWFEKADTADFTPTNYLEMGLSKINKGMVAEGKHDIDKALKMDSSEKFKTATINGIYDIGKQALENTKRLAAEGNKQIGMAYSGFAAGLLQTALEMDTTRKDIAKSLKELRGGN